MTILINIIGAMLLISLVLLLLYAVYLLTAIDYGQDWALWKVDLFLLIFSPVFWAFYLVVDLYTRDIYFK